MKKLIRWIATTIDAIFSAIESAAQDVAFKFRRSLDSEDDFEALTDKCDRMWEHIAALHEITGLLKDRLEKLEGEPKK